MSNRKHTSKAFVAKCLMFDSKSIKDTAPYEDKIQTFTFNNRYKDKAKVANSSKSQCHILFVPQP